MRGEILADGEIHEKRGEAFSGEVFGHGARARRVHGWVKRSRGCHIDDGGWKVGAHNAAFAHKSMELGGAHRRGLHTLANVGVPIEDRIEQLRARVASNRSVNGFHECGFVAADVVVVVVVVVVIVVIVVVPAVGVGLDRPGNGK